MQLMFRSAIFKLTAVFVACIMAVCLIFSTVFYHFAVDELQDGVNSQYSRWFNAYEPFGLRSPGNPAGEISRRANHLYDRLIWLNAAILLLATVLCYLLARRVLRPIERAHEQQKRFTADVSHELRTPLTALKMETEVSLLDPKTSAKGLRQTLRSNLEEVEHMETLINNLLLLSSMEASKLRTEFSSHDIYDIVSAALSTTKTLAFSKRIAVTDKLEHVRLHCDQASLTQLFVILIENAIKYSPDKSEIAVTIISRRGQLSVQIRDQGQGITDQALPHIFDRFYRADNARTNATGTPGFGLGLSLAKLIADLHNAEIIVSSAEGKGTDVNVRLPIAYTQPSIFTLGV